MDAGRRQSAREQFCGCGTGRSVSLGIATASRCRRSRPRPHRKCKPAPNGLSMRFLGIGDCCDLAALYLRLVEEGNEVKISIANPLCRGTLAGLVEQVADWRSELDWLRHADGIALFENVADNRGELQDELRRQGINVVGGSGFGDRLENDRAYAQRMLADAGLAIARSWELAHAQAALEFLAAHPGRYVLKFNGADAGIDNDVGRLEDGADVRAFLDRRAAAKKVEAS